MKNTFKRILSIALVLLMVFALMSAVACGKEDDDSRGKGSSSGGNKTNSEQNKFIDSLGGVSETFEGVISTDSYASSVEAAEAFVVEELANGRANVSVVNSKELSADEIQKANIPAELIEGCDAVEEVEVEYSVIDESSGLDSRSNVTSLASEKLDKTTKVKVYVIKFGTDWKYFSPMPVTGDTISKSYYDSVFNAEKYKNCTFEMTNSATADIKADGESMTMVMDIKQTIKHADGKVYLEQHFNVTQNGETTEQSTYAYMETVEGAIVCYVKSGDGNWMEADLTTVGFTSLEQLTPFYDQYLDYTYFTKTEYGFALEKENAKKYFTQALMGALEGMQSYIDPEKMNIDMYAEYYVCDGVLSGMRVDADVNMEISAGSSTGTLKESVTTVTKCTNYGTTVVEKPFTE